MNTYTIIRKPEILDWNKVPVAVINSPLRHETPDIVGQAQLCYDDERLYVHLSAVEKYIRAEYTGLLDAPCEDSCLEFFFSPIEGDTRYFNIEYNPNCCIYLGIGSSLQNLVRLLPLFDASFAPVANRTKNGWEITYQVPFEFIRRFFPDFKATSGKKMRGNFFKCGDLTAQEHYLTWNPVLDPATFHAPQYFGTLIFE